MPAPEVVLIAAIAEKNRVIGKDGKLPWYISEDLKRFKRLTIGHPVIMGRKTFDSIVARLGHPLPERRNLVLSKSAEYPEYPDVEVYASLPEALQAVEDERRVSLIGGESVFAAGLEIADRLELTLVAGVYDGDAFFPEFDNLKAHYHLDASDQRDGYRFETWVRN